jgi:NAD(P)-dependent dehydrogenase (short-subunit alcohol dehydrogenase family)
VSSRAHQFAGVDFEDSNFQRRPYDRWQAYGQSKTANVLFAVELDRRGEPNDVRVFAVHPGRRCSVDAGSDIGVGSRLLEEDTSWWRDLGDLVFPGESEKGILARKQDSDSL